ncbi:MAG TPA: hypothetical protein VN282_12915 [Pyrinomonadaceae bacterium]|nr:hypothetical protein [Pyrinomonadaceae bacterium]
MRRLFIQSCLALLCASTLVFAGGPPAGRRAKYNFNSGWKLFVGDPAGAQEPGFDDSGWKEVTLPRAWNEDDAFRKDIKDLSTGVAWYRKRFTPPPGSAGNRDAFGNIIEIPGTPDPQSAAGKGGAKGTLSIIELEVYEPA